MKIKLDENIGMRGGELLAERAHDVSTVGDQKLSGAPDETIVAVCAAEGRVLITLDRDFGEVLRFPPEQRWHRHFGPWPASKSAAIA